LRKEDENSGWSILIFFRDLPNIAGQKKIAGNLLIPYWITNFKDIQNYQFTQLH